MEHERTHRRLTLVETSDAAEHEDGMQIRTLWVGTLSATYLWLHHPVAGGPTIYAASDAPLKSHERMRVRRP